MPALRLRAIDLNKALTISKLMIDDLQELIQCPREYFTIEVVQSSFIMDEKVVDGLPMVEVLWFDRGQEVQDKAALIITKHINTLGYKNLDVVFQDLEKSRYYENGEHF
jgi:hypothetical protein